MLSLLQCSCGHHHQTAGDNLYMKSFCSVSAMQIVQSRTFGNASPNGTVGVHMLIPLVDLFNHGGDEIVMHDAFARSTSASNVR